jgi:hypothetical protein
MSNVRPSMNPVSIAMPDLPARGEQRGDPNGMLLLAKASKIPIERIQYLPDSTLSVIADIHCGILLVMAFWSGPSIKAFQQITDILLRLDPDGRLEFVVVDTDGAESFYEHPEFKDKLSGAGEIAWINGGVIQSTSGLGYNPECFEPNTKMLLAELAKSIRNKP